MFIPRILGKTIEEVNMTAVALVFVGITLILNGYLMWNKKETKPLIVFNLFTGGMIILFNIYVIMSGGNLVGAFGGLLFGLTNLLVAFDLIFKESPWATGNFSLLATVCAIAICAFNFVDGELLKGVMWALWSLIWLFAFIGFSLKKQFQPAIFVMLIVQGFLTTGTFGLLQLFDIVKF